MKKSVITAILSTAMMIVSGQVAAQEKDGFKKIDVKEDFTENGFQWLRDAE